MISLISKRYRLWRQRFCLVVIGHLIVLLQADLVPADAKLEELWSQGDFTEGVAAGRDGRIYFSDIARSPQESGRIYVYDPTTSEVSIHVAKSAKSNGLMFDPDGRLIACCGANNGLLALCEVTAEGTMKALVRTYRNRRFASPNDLVINARGWIYFSDPRYIGPEPMEVSEMRVYLYKPEKDLIREVTDESLIEKPNGLVLSPDQTTLYVAETNNGSKGEIETNPNPQAGRMTLTAFDIRPNGHLENKRILVDFGQQAGIDGMTVDVQGHIYAAVRSEDRYGITVYSATGKEMAYIPTPSLPTNCSFGLGKERDRLYVTAGGGLYRIRLNTKGYHPAIDGLQE